MVPARRPNLVFSVDVKTCIGEADLVFIAVNTPTKSSGIGAGAATDLAAFETVGHDIARHARPHTIVVEKSTVPCRTAELVQDILAANRPEVHLDVVLNPEFLAAGTAVKDLLHPDRIPIGPSTQTASGRRAASALANIYKTWVPRERVIGMHVWSAELAKVVANAMLAQRISSINSISAICEATCADLEEVAEAVGSDTRIGKAFLKAGIGFGGSCLKKDVLNLVYLAESLGLSHVAEYWQNVVNVNTHQLDRFLRRIVCCLNNSLANKKITILGFAFKADTSDVRESPTLDMIQKLRAEHPLEIAIFDPCCNLALIRREIETMVADGCCPPDVVVYSDIYQACATSNAVLIMTECNKFKLSPYPDSRPYTFSVNHQQYVSEPSCAEDCPDCELIQTRGQPAAAYGIGDTVNWREISYHMKQPKWLFNRKGVINHVHMAQLGFQVESIGRPKRL
ncbi:nucleotide sugar dehydrogenase [Xylaria arbuscula]|nr:nucleotide sugar dehydrogenase [Xylaria arbuscula]